jgi:hypothetical protein
MTPSLFRCFEVGAGRFELPTSRTRTVRATKLRYAPEGTNEARLKRRCLDIMTIANDSPKGFSRHRPAKDA